MSNQRKLAKMYGLMLGRLQLLMMIIMMIFCVLRMMNLKMEAASCTETLVTFYQSTHCHTPVDLNP